jgi:hypothetical protein
VLGFDPNVLKTREMRWWDTVGGHMKIYPYSSVMLFLGGLASAGLLAGLNSPAEARKLAAESFEVLGITPRDQRGYGP